MGSEVILKSDIFGYYIMKRVNIWNIYISYQTNIFQMANACVIKLCLAKKAVQSEDRLVEFNITE